VSERDSAHQGPAGPAASALGAAASGVPGYLLPKYLGTRYLQLAAHATPQQPLEQWGKPVRPAQSVWKPVSTAGRALAGVLGGVVEHNLEALRTVKYIHIKYILNTPLRFPLPYPSRPRLPRSEHVGRTCQASRAALSDTNNMLGIRSRFGTPTA
jgi:hypothetical protein